MKHAKNNKKNPAIIDGDMTVGNIYTPCVVASGSWPAGDQELTKFGSRQPFVSCFSTEIAEGTGHYIQCWSRSHHMIIKSDDDWIFYNEACEPKGFFSGLWHYANPDGWRVEGETASCGPPCPVLVPND